MKLSVYPFGKLIGVLVLGYLANSLKAYFCDLSKVEEIIVDAQLELEEKNNRSLPVDVVSNIYLDDVPNWHQVRIQDARGGKYIQGYLEVMRLDHFTHPLVTCEEKVETIDISQIFGFGASKSHLSKFNSTEDMIKQHGCVHMIDNVSEEGLKTNLEWGEIRVLNEEDGGNDHLVYYPYFGKYFLSNQGGSHHFAAAKYIAGQLGINVPIQARVCTYRINSLAVDALRFSYEAVLIQMVGPKDFVFTEELDKRRIPYYHLPLNQCGFLFSNWQLFFFPRDSKVACNAAAVMLDNGGTDFYSVMDKLLKNQRGK